MDKSARMPFDLLAQLNWDIDIFVAAALPIGFAAVIVAIWIAFRFVQKRKEWNNLQPYMRAGDDSLPASQHTDEQSSIETIPTKYKLSKHYKVGY